ncbi:MAG: M48 family metallopeptidase [Firmicutes bacterium]|nr:M48 family metallopeptidase [Bacillota bacterium]
MEVTIDGKERNVIINKKKIKNIYFRFDEELNLVINANKYITEKEIINLINKNKESLEKMLKKIERKQEKNNEFWYLGNKYDIIYNDLVRNIDFQNGTIICKDKNTLDKFIKKQTKEIFEIEVNNLRKIIKPPNFALKIRKMKSRWGVCNYKLKTITLNSELIRYNIENLRYVIVHEMCHFYHHDHSKKFWNMVSIYYPNYKQARKELRS